MLTSVNPFNGKIVFECIELDPEGIEDRIEKAYRAFSDWKVVPFKERAELMLKAASILKKQKSIYAKDISLEMGKPVSQAVSEIEKCAWVCEYYAQNAETFLAGEMITTDAYKSFVSYEPLGVILAVMPWNYPFWQVFRFAAPGIMAGNVGLLKHASNVMKSAQNIEEVFRLAGFPEGVFQNLAIGSDKVESIIRDNRVAAVTLTGSKPAGSAVAATAASVIKKSVLELGGSNAFIVFKDADIEKAVSTAVNARFQNDGQSCIAAKRLLLHQSIEDEFMQKFSKAVKDLKCGDPLDESTYIGVLAREDLAIDLEKQVESSLKMGAVLETGGRRCNAFYEPTILRNVTPKMPVFREETFGPVMAVTTFNTTEEAIEMSNMTEFGLGVSLFTKNIAFAESLVPLFKEGAVFINELVKSDPRLPFGGVKESGFGRELSRHGIKEFVNVKTVFINQ